MCRLLGQIEKDQNEAEAYANDVIPRARGEAEQVLQQAEATKRKLLLKQKVKQVDS